MECGDLPGRAISAIPGVPWVLIWTWRMMPVGARGDMS